MRLVLVLLVALVCVALGARMRDHGPTDPDVTGSIATAGPDRDPWIGKPVMSADGAQVGTVAAVTRDADGRASAVTIAVPSLFGIGSTPVTVPVTRGAFDGEVVRLRQVATDVGDYAATR